MWLPLLPFNKLMKEKIPWEGEFTLRRSLSAAANGLILVMELLQLRSVCNQEKAVT